MAKTDVGELVVVVPGFFGYGQSELEYLPTLYCPACGVQTVWHETGPGDYYVGETFHCSSCGATGSMWGAEQSPQKAQSRQMEMLREALAMRSDILGARA